MSQEAKNGDTVTVHYTGKLEDGTVFDTSEGRDPITFKLGEGSIIAGFESAVVGMQEGEEKNIHIEPEEAYGPWLKDNVIEVSRKNLEGDVDPEIGQQVYLQRSDGETFSVIISDISEDIITLDANHPLAGKCLNFELRLVQIAAA